MVGGGPVHVEVAVDPTEGGGDHHGLPVGHEAEVADEGLVEDAGDGGPVERAPVGLAPDARRAV